MPFDASYADSSVQPVFLTWWLEGSLPIPAPELGAHPARDFLTFDRLLDQASAGPTHFLHPGVSDVFLHSLYFHAILLGHFTLHSYVLMPNHVHLLLTPQIPLALLTRTLQGATAKKANRILHRQGQPFWQADALQYPVPGHRQFRRIQRFIEQSPVRAGLSECPEVFPFSSAAPHVPVFA